MQSQASEPNDESESPIGVAPVCAQPAPLSAIRGWIARLEREVMVWFLRS